VKLLSIEPTPSPNSMKLTVSETLPMGTSYNFTQENKNDAIGILRDLLNIDGVKGLYRVSNFIALERFPKAEWEVILRAVRQVFGEEDEKPSSEKAEDAHEEAFGEVRVFIQKFRGIPMQIKLLADGEEIRVGLPDRFMEAIMTAQAAATNIILERRWEEQSPRYGEVEDIEKDLLEEISAAYDQERLDDLVKRAIQGEPASNKEYSPFQKVTLEMLDDPDWRKRYAALERMDPQVEDLPVLAKALRDPPLGDRLSRNVGRSESASLFV